MVRSEGKLFVLSGRWWASPLCCAFLLFGIYHSIVHMNSPSLGLKGQLFRDLYGVPAQQIHAAYGALCVFLFLICFTWMLFKSSLARRVIVSEIGVTILPSLIFRQNVTIPYDLIYELKATDDPGYSNRQKMPKHFRECVLFRANGRRYKFGSYSFRSWAEYLEFCDAIGVSRNIS